MRFDRTGNLPTAADFLRTASEAEILRVLRDYGEEPKAFFIAKAVVANRKANPLTTTGQFLKLIEESSLIRNQRRAYSKRCASRLTTNSDMKIRSARRSKTSQSGRQALVR